MSRFFKYILTFILFTNSVFASSLYWVNGSGNWNDPAHWSLTSGGKGNAGIPTLNDNVIFDQNSFSVFGQIVAIKKQAYCNNFTWKHTGLNPILTGKARAKLNVNGSFNSQDNLTDKFYGTISLTGSDNSYFSSHSSLNANLFFDNPDGKFELTSEIKTSGNIYLKQGNLNTNNQNITCSEFNISGKLQRSLYLSSSYITIDVFNAKKIENLYFNAENSTLLFKERISYKIMNLGTLEYYDIKTKNGLSKAGSAVVVINSGCNGQNDASISITITGGNPDFMYWLKGFDPVIKSGATHTFNNVPWANSYFLRVYEDGGSTQIIDSTFDLVEPPLLEAKIDTIQLISCYGNADGELEANVVGANIGTPPYQYLWSPGGQTTKVISGLDINDYRVNITDANGCENTTNKTTLYTPPISIDNVDSTNACQGVANGSLTITASGGTGTLQYSLDDGVAYPYQNNNTFSGLAAGTYEIWVKDANGCTTQRTTDATVVETPAPTANAGVDQEMCEDDNYTISGASATEYSSILWEKLGDGTIQSGTETTFTPTYTAGAGDIAAGFAKLVLHAVGNTPCTDATDTIVLAIILKPVVEAGPDDGVCSNSTYVVSGASVSNFSSYVWTTTGAGTLTGNTTLTPSYTPDLSDPSVVELRLTAQNPPCAQATDFFNLTIYQAPTADAGSDGQGCQGKSFSNFNADTTNSASVYWSTATGGTFTNGNTLNPTYNPSAADYTNGSVVLTLHAVGNADCVEATSNMTVFFNNPPTANAGGAGEVCENASFTLSGASAANQSSVEWTSSGTGTWDDASLVNATYTPSANDISAGSVTLTLTVHGLGNCDDAIDNMTLTITQAPVAEAGNDGTTCQGVPFSDFNASANNYSSLSWSTSNGTGTITNSATIAPTYTPGLGETGTIKLYLTAFGNGSCTQAKDSMQITISPAPTVNAGPDKQTCSDSPYTITGASESNADAVLWSILSGAGSFDDNTNINTTYTPHSSDAGTIVHLQVTASSAGCIDDTDDMFLTVTSAPSAEAGNDEEICEGNSINITTADTSNAASINWTTSAGGTWTNQTNINPTFTPDAAGTFYLTLHATGNGSCNEAIDSMKLTVNPAPIVDAGNNETICEGQNLTVSTADSTNAVSVIWSTPDGGGFFDNSMTLTPTYHPTAADVTAGSITLRITATGLADCGIVTDDMILTIESLPSVEAGTDGTACEGSAYSFADASVDPGYTKVEWTGGTGTFIDSSAVNSIYTPSADDAANSPVKFYLTATYPNSCNEVVDSVTLTITAAATAYAGIDTSICHDDSYTLADAVATNYTSLLWATSGDGSFDNNASQNPVYTPGPQDQTDGSVTLTLQATGNAPCSNVTDDMVLAITSELVAAIGQPAPFTIDASTQIDVSFTANHDLVQDLGFYLVAPDGTTLELMEAPSDALCNHGSGDNIVNNFTFSTTETTTFDKCRAPAEAIAGFTLEGTWASENAWNPFYGMNPAAGGWSVQIHDCGAFNDGLLTNVTLKFKNGNDSVYYSSGVLNIAIESPTGSGCIAATYYMENPDLTVSCNGECDATAILSISGGSGNYNIAWENHPEFAGMDTVLLCAGDYKAIVADSQLGCTDTAEVTVLQPPQILLTKDSTNVTCKGADDGTASVTPSNGNAPYVYIWTKEADDTISQTSSVSSLAPGKYYIYVTDDNGNGCMVMDSVTISEPDSITYASVITQTNCNASTGIITITPAGGTPAAGVAPYTYTWSPNVAETDSIAENLSVGIYKFTITDANSCTKVDSLEMTDAGTITVTTFDTTGVSGAGICDGIAKVNYTGETGPVSYLWNDPSAQDTQTATGLCGGVTYTVTVTDDNTACADIGTITLWEPTAIAVNITDSTMVLCNGDATGAATATASGGTGSYTYEWRDSLTMTLISSTSTVSNLIAGKYYVTVNGTAKDSVIITQPDAISATLSITNPDCNQSNGIIAVIDTTGGVGNFSFTWDTDLTTITSDGDSALNVASGAYDIIVVDGNACQLPLTANVSEITPFSVSITDSTLISCNGLSDGDATVSVSGATSPITYLWSNGDTTAFADTLSAQVYTVSITDASTCTAVITVNITEPPILSSSLTDTVNVKCFGDLYDSVTVSVSGGTPNYMFSWSTGDTDSTAYNLAGGQQTVAITDANNCQAFDTVFVKQPDAITIDTLLTLANCSDSSGQIKVTPAGGTSPYDFKLYDADSVLIDSAFTLTTFTFDTLWVDFYGVKIIDANACELLEIVRVSDTSSLSTYINPDSVGHLTCNTVCDGHALVEVTGGTPDYSYLWNGGVHTDSAFVDSLCAGFYIVTITDANSCSHVDSVTISDNDVLQANIKESGNASCNGLSDGYAIGEGLLGTPFTSGEPYAYKWDDPTASTNDTVNNLSARWYRLTVSDANLCEAVDSVEITEPIALNYNTTKLDIYCYGDSTGSLRIEPVGGTAPFTILAFNPDSVLIDSVVTDTVLNLLNLYAGKYYFTISDAGLCEVSGDRSVDEANQIIPTISMVKTACADSTGSFTIDNVVGGLPGNGSYTVAYNYKWSHPDWAVDSTRYKLENLWVDFYTLNIEDSYGCSIDTTLEMLDNSNINFDIIIDTVIYCLNDSNAYAHIDTASATGTTGNSSTWTYQWWQDNNKISDSIYADSLYLLTYKAYLIDQIGCRKVKQFEMPDSSLKATFVNTNNFSCSEENFGSSIVTAVGGMYPYTIKWFLNDGVTPYTDTTRIDSVSIRANHLAAGTYIVEISDANPKGCTNIDSTEIFEPDAFELEFINQIDNVCYGYNSGSVTVKASGGVPPYEFTWVFGADTIPADSIILTDTSATIQNLYAGQYNISILDSRGLECGIDSVVEILQPDPVTWDYIVTKTNCNDSTGAFSIDITDVVPPTAPFIVTWDNEGFSSPFIGEDIANLWVDTFYVQIEDINECFYYDSVLMPDNSQFEISISAVNPACYNRIDGSLKINEEIPGVIPYSYIWSTSPDTVLIDNLSNLDKGNYSVTVIDAEFCKRYTNLQH